MDSVKVSFNLSVNKTVISDVIEKISSLIKEFEKKDITVKIDQIKIDYDRNMEGEDEEDELEEDEGD